MHRRHLGLRGWAGLVVPALDPAFDGFSSSGAAVSTVREIALGSAGAGWDGEEEDEPSGAGWWRSVP